MHKLFVSTFALILSLFIFASPVMAQESPPEILEFTSNTLEIITLVATASAVFFLIRAGYVYITSAGNPEALQSAKKTVRNTLVGLTLVLSATIVTSVFQSALQSTQTSGQGTTIDVVQIETVEPSEGLTQVLIDAVSGFIQNIVESSTQPVVNAVLGYLTTTPTLFDNEVIRNFWLISVGIVDGLFVLVIALMGLKVMSASTFGFKEVDIKQLLPRLGLTFLGANISLFLTRLVRRARKHFLGVTIISQQANDFLNQEYGRAIASQSSLRILMKQDTTTIKKVAEEFNLSEYEQHFLLTCDRSEALIIADQNHVALKVVASDKEHPMLTTDPREIYL